MGSLVNMVLGGGLAVAVVLTFWLLASFVGDAEHR
jgi:hypothetical protein